jgi:hypothetical protein
MSKLEPGIVDGEILTAIQIDYEPESPDPSRIFRAMAQLIDAMHSLDTDLAGSVSTKIKPVQVLHEIEVGSLIAWVRTIIEQIDDEALKNLDWKPIVGQYLVKGKHKFLKWLGGKETLRMSKRSKRLNRTSTHWPNKQMSCKSQHTRLCQPTGS